MLSLGEDPYTSNILGQSCKSGDSFQPTCKKIVRCLFNIFSKNCVSDLNSRSHGTKRSTVSEHGQLQAKARKLKGFQCLMQVSCVKTPIKVLNLSQNVLLCSTVSVHFLFFYSTTRQAQNWAPSQILSRGLWRKSLGYFNLTCSNIFIQAHSTVHTSSSSSGK